MATTYADNGGAYGDPTFLAYDRARQQAEATLNQNASRDQLRNTQDEQTGVANLNFQQQGQVDNNTAQYRASGFGISGLRAQAEGRIRQSIAQQIQALLTQHQRAGQDITDALTQQLASNAVETQNQQSDALSRLTQDRATAGVGL